jgi:uncharacterized integral membrane protein
MIRLVPMVLATVAFVVFAVSNGRRVPLNFVFGATEVPLIFLVLASFTAGALSVFFHAMVKTAERRQLKKLRIQMTRAAAIDGEQEAEAE